MSAQTGGAARPSLRRSVHDRMVFGVCGGLAQYFGIDPVLVRLAFVLTTLAGGAGVIAYVILAIVVPNEDAADAGAPGTPAAPRSGPGGQPTQLAAVVLIGLGALLLLGNLGWLGWLRGDLVWPALLIVLGAAILLTNGRGR